MKEGEGRMLIVQANIKESKEESMEKYIEDYVKREEEIWKEWQYSYECIDRIIKKLKNKK